MSEKKYNSHPLRHFDVFERHTVLITSTTQLAGEAALVRGVRRWDLVALMINCIIGAGIFGLPSQIYSLTGAYSLTAFAACGVLVAILAVCYAEVSSRFTETGGPYLYATHAFGPVIGFQVGWLAVLARLGSLAFVSNVGVNYFTYFWPAAGERLWRTLIIIGLFIVLTAVNLIGVRQTAVTSNVLTIGKLAPIFLFVAVGLFFLDRYSYSFAARPSLGSFSLAVSQLFFAFTGFELGSIATGETCEPQRNMPFAILTALGLVVVIYILIQIVCIGTLPSLASSQKPIADASRLFLGAAGASVITAGVVVSALGNLNAILLGGSRLLFAMAEHSALPRAFAQVNPRFHTPYLAILVVAGLGLLLACTGTFRYTLTLAAISKIITFIAVAAALPVLRHRKGAPPALLRMPAGVAFSVIGMTLCVWLVAHSGWREVRDVAVVSAAGFAVYILPWKKTKENDYRCIVTRAGLRDRSNTVRYGQALIFPMDARGTPAGVGQTHSADEVPDFAGNRGTAAITPALPTPVQSESLSVPGNDRCRFDDEERRPPFIP